MLELNFKLIITIIDIKHSKDGGGVASLHKFGIK